MVVAGSVRKKSLQNTMLKNLLDACGSAIAFYCIGYAVRTFRISLLFCIVSNIDDLFLRRLTQHAIVCIFRINTLTVCLWGWEQPKRFHRDDKLFLTKC